MLLMMDSRGDLGALIEAELSYAGYLGSETKSAGHLYGILREYQSRFVPEIKHTVELSDTLKANPKLEIYKVVVDEICDVLKAGGNLRPYMSSKIDRFAKHGRDYLQLHWGLSHLHLSSIATVRANGLVERADDLLFLRVKNGVAHLVDILAHSEVGIFENKRLLDVVDRNWPRLHVHAKGISKPTTDHTPEQIRRLRRLNYQHVEWVNGRAVMPTYGTNAAGTPSEAIIQYDRMRIQLDVIQHDIRKRFFTYFPANRNLWLAYVRLYEVAKDGYLVREINSNQDAKALYPSAS